MATLCDIVKPRKDRKDESKTHWDPIGVCWVGEDDTGKMKAWGSIFAIGDVQIFPRDNKKDDNPYG